MLPSTYSVELADPASGSPGWTDYRMREAQTAFMARLAKYKPSCSDCGSTAKHHKPGTASCKRAALMRAVRGCTAHSFGCHGAFDSWQKIEYEAQIKLQREADSYELEIAA